MAKSLLDNRRSSLSGLKPPTQRKGFIAALKALRHPKSSFFS
jgi:hypothetical protein